MRLIPLEANIVPVKYAAVGPIAVHLPERVETNAQLQAEFPSWDIELIYQKTGIASRHIAAPGECASDMAVKACERLFRDYDIDPRLIDFLLFCTQTPDYPLPTTACSLQSRLGLKTCVGALPRSLDDDDLRHAGARAMPWMIGRTPFMRPRAICSISKPAARIDASVRRFG